MDSLMWNDALTRIQVEYVEMPDLKLTPRQIGRLCNLPQDLCAAALAALVRTGFLLEAQGGTYLRRGLGRRRANLSGHGAGSDAAAGAAPPSAREPSPELAQPSVEPIDRHASDAILGSPSLADALRGLPDSGHASPGHSRASAE